MSTRHSARFSARGETNGGSIRRATLAISWWHRMELSCEEEQVSAGREAAEEFESLNTRLRRYASTQAFVSDSAPLLIRASQVERVEAITAGGRRGARKLRRKERIEDNDLLAKRCRAFRREHPELGA